MNHLDDPFIDAVRLELQAARTKFPNSVLCFTALVEEVGELAEALLKRRAGQMGDTDVWLEAVQVAVMAMRVVTEGDASFDKADYTEPKMPYISNMATSDSDFDAD